MEFIRACISNVDLQVDSYMAQRMPTTFLPSLQSRLVLPSTDVTLSGTRYNVPLLNALVFYVGIQVVLPASSKSGCPLCHCLRIVRHHRVIVPLLHLCR